jgi:hypothetical protein
LVLGVLALLAMLISMTAAPAMANHIVDEDRDCFPFCNNNRHNDNGDVDEDVDVEGPFLVDDEICVFVVSEEEDNDGDVDLDVDEKWVDLGDVALASDFQEKESPL